MRLPAVLTPLELPVAELSALRLDGEAFALDEAVIAVDEPELAVNRARALTALFDPRMIAELDTALWVHGGSAVAPVVHTAAIRRDGRGRMVPTTRIAIRETTVPDAEVEELGGVRVTTRARTAVDVALLASVSGAQADAVRVLFRSPAVVAGALSICFSLGHTPGKRRALGRLEGWSLAS